MAEAAASAGLDPDLLSFMRSISLVCRQVTDQAAFPPAGSNGPGTQRLRRSWNLERVSKGRRKRTYPRVIKKCKGRTFPVNSPVRQASGTTRPGNPAPARRLT